MKQDKNHNIFIHYIRYKFSSLTLILDIFWLIDLMRFFFFCTEQEYNVIQQIQRGKTPTNKVTKKI